MARKQTTQEFYAPFDDDELLKLAHINDKKLLAAREEVRRLELKIAQILAEQKRRQSA
jgi:hypothetical protein